MAEHTATLDKWKHHDFFAPNTVVLGLDIGIEGIGIAVRKGTELVYCKTLLVNLPQAKALAKRRQRRAARHARKNYRVRMRRLQTLFAQHNLPWVPDEISRRSDPYKLRHRAIASKLASKEALSLCIRSCVAHRGYDYYALVKNSGSGEYPWGDSQKYTDAAKWVCSAYIDSHLKDYLLNTVTELQKNNGAELDDATAAEWKQLVEERHAKADQEGIEAKLNEYAHTHLNERKYRGMNYPRAHVAQHLQNILQRHKDMIDDYDSFVDALFLPCDNKEAKKHAIFYYNRKTATEADAHYEKKVKACPYCGLLDIAPQPCGLRGDLAIRRWKLIDFLSNRTFDIVYDKTATRRTTLPANAVQAMVAALDEGLLKWIDVRKRLDAALKPAKLQTGTASDWNKLQIEHLKDICTPDASTRKGRASISSEAADALFNLATQNGTVYAPADVETWKKDWELYQKRAEIDAIGGIYPQVRTLLGTLRIRQGRNDGTFATTGFLQRIFSQLADKLGGKTAPDYCVIECIKNPATTTKRAAEIQKEQNENRARKLKHMKEFDCPDPKNSDFLRMRLFEEQGGSKTTNAICPFTGLPLGNKPFDDELQLAHLFPDSRGGLYIAENLVLTKKKTNADMDNRTPREAAQAHLENWLSWEDMLKLSANFKWNDKKRKLFAFETTAEESFPDFNNMTRTAQLARELRRLVAVWMGISKDVEACRCRIGNPCGSYTAAARRDMLWEGYVKDRSNNLHHRLDAAVMTCIPPAEGLNDIQYGGIFYTDKSQKHRVLSVIRGLPLPDFHKMWEDASTPRIVKPQSRSKSKSLGDSTFWGECDSGKTHQRTKINIGETTAANLYSILLRMGLPQKKLPTEKEIQKWLVNCQAATKQDAFAPIKPLRMKLSEGGKGKGIAIKNIWKFGVKEHKDDKKGKGDLRNSPLGWSGVIIDNKRFDQLRKLDDTNDRLEIWLGWNAKKKCWAYYKRVIPTAAALAGLKRMGIPWRGINHAPDYLLQLLERKKAKDLKTLICGTLPPHAIKIGHVRKGDSLYTTFEANKEEAPVSIVNHLSRLPISAQGCVSSVRSDTVLEISCLEYKGRKKATMSRAEDIVVAFGTNMQMASRDANEEANKRHLSPPKV